MRLYLLSFFGRNKMPGCVDGVCGVFNSLEKAITAVGQLCAKYDEHIIDYDYDSNLWCCFTDKGTYSVDFITMNETVI